MNILKQSTAATIKLGPFIDDSDGKTAETGLTISQADIRLSKNGGDFAQTHNATGATHDEFGYYDIPLDTTDTNTLGRLRVAVSESGALPVWQDFLVVTANVYDTLCSTDTFDVNVTALANDVITSNAFDESSAYPLKSADTGSTQVARVGADSDTLETLSDEIAAVKAETAAILVDTGTTLDGNITAILADTNEVQAELADGGRTDLLIEGLNYNHLRRMCFDCPIQKECLQAATAFEPYGFWGGLSEDERRHIYAGKLDTRVMGWLRRDLKALNVGLSALVQTVLSVERDFTFNK